MKIRSALFERGITDAYQVPANNFPQIACIGRSNVGKSSVINSLVGQKELARTSSFPGRTQQINLFLINSTFYLVDLPGYGYADISEAGRQKLQKLIAEYISNPAYTQKKIVFIIDAEVGFTADDLEMLHALETLEKNVVIVANKIDKIAPSSYAKKTAVIQELAGRHPIIWYSAKKKIGTGLLITHILEAVGSKTIKKNPLIFGGPSVTRGVRSRKRGQH